MGHSQNSLIGVILAGCVVLIATSDPFYSATAAVSDPFAALRVTKLTTGTAISSFELKALNGETLRSQDLAGTVVLLNFWATWCGPCKEEMPSLAKLQTHFAPEEVRVVTVTTDIYPQGITQFLEHLGIRLPVLLDENQELSQSFMVRGLPTTVLIAQDGRLVGRAVGPRAWDSQESVALVRQVLQGTR